MGELGEVAEHQHGIGAGIVLRAEFLQRARQVGAHQRLEQIDDLAAVGKAEHLPYVFGANRTGRRRCAAGSAGMRDRLVEQRECVAHRALGGARDQPQRFRLGGDRFLAGDARQMLDQKRRVDPPKIEPLAARKDGNGDLADFRRGEHELGVRRRLFQRLEERIEGGARKHVHFVEDVDLVARRDRRIADRIVDRADVLDAVVRGRVHLDDVEMPALHDRLAVYAENRHVDRRAGDRAVRQFVIERARQDTRRRGLADPAHAREHPGLRNAAALEGVRNRADHRILADQIREGRWPVFAREHAIGTGRIGHLGRRVVHRRFLARRPKARGRRAAGPRRMMEALTPFEALRSHLG